MREIIAGVCVFFLLRLTEGGGGWQAFGWLVSLFLVFYIVLCLGERWMMRGGGWFRATPGAPQEPELDPEEITKEERAAMGKYERFGRRVYAPDEDKFN